MTEGTYYALPAGGAHPHVKGCGQEDDEQQCEEKGDAADKLKEVQRWAADADADQLLQDEGHQWQELARNQEAGP